MHLPQRATKACIYRVYIRIFAWMNSDYVVSYLWLVWGESLISFSLKTLRNKKGKTSVSLWHLYVTIDVHIFLRGRHITVWQYTLLSYISSSEGDVLLCVTIVVHIFLLVSTSQEVMQEKKPTTEINPQQECDSTRVELIYDVLFYTNRKKVGGVHRCRG